MIRRPPRSTRTDTLFPTRRSSDLKGRSLAQGWPQAPTFNRAISTQSPPLRMDESISPPVHAECRQRRCVEERAPLQKTSRTACLRLLRLALVRQLSLIDRIVLASRRHAVRGDIWTVGKGHGLPRAL